MAAALDSIALDFGGLRRVSPGALTALVATVTGWQAHGRKVEFLNLDQCVITGYLQRMDVLKSCGAELPENFKRHSSKGRFVPVCPLKGDVDQMGHEMAICLAPGGEDYDHPNAAIYDLLWYVFTETANNARQHSHGMGYASAQVARAEGLVRISIADNGKGIRQSFIDAGFSWARSMSEGEAILKALEPRVSSRGRPTNEGVGLTLVAELAQQVAGWLLVVSGGGMVRIKRGEKPEIEPLPQDTRFAGTLIIAAFRQKNVMDFANILQNAKVKSGLLRAGRQSGIFEQ